MMKTSSWIALQTTMSTAIVPKIWDPSVADEIWGCPTEPAYDLARAVAKSCSANSRPIPAEPEVRRAEPVNPKDAAQIPTPTPRPSPRKPRPQSPTPAPNTKPTATVRPR